MDDIYYHSLIFNYNSYYHLSNHILFLYILFFLSYYYLDCSTFHILLSLFQFIYHNIIQDQTYQKLIDHN